MIETCDLGFVDGLASECLTCCAVDTFSDAAVISLAEHFGEDDVIVEYVGADCDGLGDGLLLLLLFLVLCTLFEVLDVDVADLVEIIIDAVVAVRWVDDTAISLGGWGCDSAHGYILDWTR